MALDFCRHTLHHTSGNSGLSFINTRGQTKAEGFIMASRSRGSFKGATPGSAHPLPCRFVDRPSFVPCRSAFQRILHRFLSPQAHFHPTVSTSGTLRALKLEQIVGCTHILLNMCIPGTLQVSRHTHDLAHSLTQRCVLSHTGAGSLTAVRLVYCVLSLSIAPPSLCRFLLLCSNHII